MANNDVATVTKLCYRTRRRYLLTYLTATPFFSNQDKFMAKFYSPVFIHLQVRMQQYAAVNEMPNAYEMK